MAQCCDSGELLPAPDVHGIRIRRRHEGPEAPAPVCSGQGRHSLYDQGMDTTLKNLPVENRLRIVEDLWDSIAIDQGALPLTPERKAELDRRLDAFALDGDPGRPAREVISVIRKRL